MANHARSGLLVAILAAIIWTCGGTLFPERSSGRAVRIVVYGFSVLAEPLRDEIFPLFRARWRRESGEDIDFVDSFAASGTIANQIVNGTPAHVAVFSHPGDADRVAAAGRVRTPWRGRPHGGILNRTAIIILVRHGNPKGIRTFRDLGRPGIALLHPDPLTSGGAQWAVLAEYAEPILLARDRGVRLDPEVARAQLTDIWRNVVAQAPSARAARSQFDTGFGDAVVTYEVEVFSDLASGRPAEMVVPERTILTEHPLVVLDGDIAPSERRAVDAFVAYLHSEEAQRVFVRHGFRSVLPQVEADEGPYARIPRAYTVAELGGWDDARSSIVEHVFTQSVLAEVRR